MIISFEFNGIKYRNFDISDVKVRQQLEDKNIDLLLIVRKGAQEHLLTLEEQRVYKVLKQYGYISLSDIQLYANQNDIEAQSLLNWYQVYDNEIWNWIDNDLQSYQTIDELLSLDMKSIEEQIYQKSLTTSPLP